MFLAGFHVGPLSLLNWICRCWFLVEGRKPGCAEKNPLSKARPDNKINRCVSLQMPLASRCQKHNAQAYHHLVCEQHFFLRTLCLADSTAKEDKKRKKLKKLLCESAANLAELFARSVLDTNSICLVLEALFMHILSEFSGSQHTGLHNLPITHLNSPNGVFRSDTILG